MTHLQNHLYIVSTIVFTLYSQLVMKWQVSRAGDLPEPHLEKVWFVFNLLISPWVMTAILATFFAGVSWMLAMSKFQLSYAYPFVSANFALVFIASVLLFGESVSLAKLFGTLLIVLGIIVIGSLG